VPIHITDADISMGEFFFSIFTNSSHQCDLSVNIFNDSILTHHFTTPNFFTGSSECNYAKQNYDIPYRFTLPPGQYTVDISTSQPVQFYQLHLHHYDQTFVNTLGFEPRDYDPIPTNDCSYNKYVVIPNISAAYGGMWWCIYQALVGIHVADTNNLIPIVNYHGDSMVQTLSMIHRIYLTHGGTIFSKSHLLLTPMKKNGSSNTLNRIYKPCKFIVGFERFYR